MVKKFFLTPGGQNMQCRKKMQNKVRHDIVIFLWYELFLKLHIFATRGEKVIF